MPPVPQGNPGSLSAQTVAREDWAGAIHVHSLYSDGSGTFSEIVNAAAKAGLDYVIFNDHGSHKLYDKGAEDYYGKTMVLIGQEIGRRMGHCLAIGTTEKIDDPTGDVNSIASGIKKQGAMPVLAHPEGKAKLLFGTHDNSWKTRSDFPMDGMEVWSFMYDWIDNLHWFNGPHYYKNPERVLTGPGAETLKLWDRLCQTKPVVGIAGLDAHAKQILGLTAFPYEFMFRTLRTHVLTTPPTGDFGSDRNLVLDAMKAGHVYFSNDFQWPSKGFSFEADCDGRTYVQGDRFRLGGSAVLMISLPCEAAMRVVRNGETHEISHGDHWELTVNKAGVYRVEAKKEGQAWIFSNPLYIRS